jgi:cell division protein FtsI (penicillin-binding protein 3)
MAAIGNGGTLYEPHVIARVVDGEKVVFAHQPRGRRILSERTSAEMRAMLATVFEGGKNAGTASKVVIDGFRAGGKTGTAKKIDPATRRYGEKMYLSSFIGVAPIEEPRIAVVVMIDEPRGQHYYGGTVAGPAFARIVEESLRYLGIPASAPAPAADGAGEPDPEPADPPDPIIEADEVPAPHPGGDDGAAGHIDIPDFRGLGVAPALDLARERGVSIEIEGSGRAIEQHPPPGRGAPPAAIRVVFAPGPG